MTSATIHILLVEDSPSDAELLQQSLHETGVGRFEFTWVECLSEALARLARESFDVVLLDLSLPDSAGPDTFRRAHQAAPCLPIVVLTGAHDERLGLAAVHEGVQDYLVKGEADGRQIARAIRYAVERNRAEEQLRQQREWLRVTLASIGDAVVACDTAGRINFLNPTAELLTGFQTAEALGQPIQRVFRIVNEQSREPADDLVSRALSGRRAVSLAGNTVLLARDGREVPIEDSAAPILDAAGQVLGVVLVFHDVAEKRRGQAALAAAHAAAVNEKNRLQAVMESLPVGVALLDAEGGNTQANPAFEQLWGRPRPPVRSCRDLAAYHAWWVSTGKPVQPEEWASFRALQNGETVVGEELEIQRFDGTRAFVLNSAAPVRDSHGRVAGGAVAILDVTERKRAEHQIRHQNRILAAINRIFGEALACDTEEQLGRSCLAVVEEVTGSRFGFIGEINAEGRLDDIAISDPGWDACRMEGPAGHRNLPAGFQVHGLYGRVLVHNKSFFTNDAAAHPDSLGVPAGHPPIRAFLGVPLISGGKTIGMIGLGNREGGYRPQDLEACETLAPAIVQVLMRKRAERERERLVKMLRESVAESNRNRAQLEAVLQGIHDGVIVFDMQGQVVFANEAAVRIAGFPGADAIRQNLACFARLCELFHMDGRPVPLAEWPVSKVLGGESVADWELCGRRQDTGQEWVLSFSGEPVRDSEANQILAVVIIRDITERKRAEERMRHTQKLESVGVLAGGIAHDFNNILTGIMGNASLAQLDASPEVGERLGSIVEASERAAALTRQLLAYAGKGQFEIADFELSRVVQSTSDLIRVSIPKNVELLLDVPAGLPLLRGDPAQIQQVVMNLVINAAEAIGETRNGAVSITAGVREITPGTPVAAGFDLAPGSYVFLRVRDDGCGMDETTRARIFDPFFTTKFTGRGLGLAAVQGILRAHKGGVGVQSKPGKGSTLTMYLPAASQPSQHAPAPNAGLSRQRAARVLVVDDEYGIRRFAKAALEHLGHTVLLAEDGRQALEVLRANSAIDLVLLDVVMPVLGGGEVLAEIRRQWPGLAVLVMSGYNREEAHRLGPVPADLPFIEKPFSLQKLAASVQDVLRVRSEP